jgi:hypothetical protein
MQHADERRKPTYLQTGVYSGSWKRAFQHCLAAALLLLLNSGNGAMALPQKVGLPGAEGMFTFFNALQSSIPPCGGFICFYVLLYAKSTIPNAQHDLGGIL